MLLVCLAILFCSRYISDFPIPLRISDCILVENKRNFREVSGGRSSDSAASLRFAISRGVHEVDSLFRLFRFQLIFPSVVMQYL